MTTTVSEHTDLFLGGQWVTPDSPEMDEVVSPATEEVIARVAVPSIDDATRAIDAARQAFDHGPWPRLTMAERADRVAAFADAFEARREEFDAEWVAESGPTVAHAAGLDGAVVLAWRDLVERAKGMSVGERRELTDGKVDVVREPLGVAVVITTWNGPGLYLAMKVVPALLAGCTVIVKTAYESQLTGRLIGEFAKQAGLPDGVLSVLSASSDVSEYLVKHKDIDKVSLTGSIPAGRSVMAACASHITNVTLELGGKSPALIADDIALDRVLPSLIPGFVAYQGQICAALTRLLVPRNRHDEIVSGVVERLRTMKVGDPTDPANDLGPLASRRQWDRVRGYIATGQDEGATLVLGGGRPNDRDRGFYLEPTVFSDVTSDMRIAQEEIFGPVLCVLAYDDLDEAVRIANSTEYGLAASIYASDAQLASELAGRIQAGTVAINTAGVSLFAPFGGYKQSGFGRENGEEGIGEYLQYKSIKLT